MILQTINQSSTFYTMKHLYKTIFHTKEHD